MTPAVMWPVCGCNCMRYIKNVWASQHVWGLQGPQVLTLPIAYIAPSMFCESVFGLCGLCVAHMASKGIWNFCVSTLLVIREILLRDKLLGNTIGLFNLTLHHRWTDHTGDDYCKCLLKCLDIHCYRTLHRYSTQKNDFYTFCPPHIHTTTGYS
jgi:hypothetical protein